MPLPPEQMPSVSGAVQCFSSPAFVPRMLFRSLGPLCVLVGLLCLGLGLPPAGSEAVARFETLHERLDRLQRRWQSLRQALPTFAATE